MAAGRPTKLTDEVLSKIKEMLLDGVSEKMVRESLEIPRSTWETWKALNYDDFRTNILDYRLQYKLDLADSVSEEILTTPHSVGEDGRVDNNLLSLKQRESQFIRETLGKELYSKRVENTGKDGKELFVAGFKFVKNGDNTADSTD